MARRGRIHGRRTPAYPKHQQQLQKKLNELNEAEQYALVATKEGLFPCLHSGHAVYHLHIGEVWKYGVTTKGERGRYTTQFLLDNSVSYVVQYVGRIGDCLQAEQTKLFSYPVLPKTWPDRKRTGCCDLLTTRFSNRACIVPALVLTLTKISAGGRSKNC